MGGSVLMTAFIHSCFLNTYNSTDISHSSSSSFFGIFNSGSGNHDHTAINQTRWDHWSQIEVQISGGEVLGHGRLTRNNRMNRTQCDQWANSVKANRMVPLQFHLTPITNLMIMQKLPFNPIKVANVNRSIAEYVHSVQAENDNLVRELMPNDPYCIPPWCQFAPKPDFPVSSSVPLPKPPPPPYNYCKPEHNLATAGKYFLH